ncbi:hypothetical protein DQ238_01235 [Geodermatophilus sp. TF02-6]|uniref:hypothetical protein n=1 Tax=Geodermatophilus sp. TF02-6 TaxID=2250575 RepID=UPI000DE9B92A|nr:hypothetical protein [Geodermatophilus sp. TF02-6]RBY83730.1 hypothetical protein DQ238_01235 [Geodermatophilus sp. TF02-6]
MITTALPLAPPARWRDALKASGLPPTAILVGHRLTDRGADDATAVLMPALWELADACQVPLPVVRRCLTVLTAAGWIAPATDDDGRRLAVLTDPTGDPA